MTPDQVKAWQRQMGIAADGIVGRDTLRAWFSRFGADVSRSVELALSANIHFRTFGILDTSRRMAHFMAQVAHESGGFRYMEEIASGQAYEGRGDLGNTAPGDGKRFKGRGPIQLTGRANYRLFGRTLGIDFENNPEVVALPSVGLMVACQFWQMRGLNELADADEVERITKRINGGLNGYDERKKLLVKAKGLLNG